MRLTTVALLAAILALSACSSSHKVTYSGHEESTVGVPGFKNGKRVAPNVKLGQSYTVDGETYTPRHQPDYVEEGLASWYGPGFHGGKTANGERFDKNDMTAAHRTLPLPSIVSVTMLSTGKQVFVRVNDRGPFSKGRIIDLSRAAAEKIGLVAKGVDRVRVEYLPAESQMFADLLEQGRDPKSIDVEREILGQAPTRYASAAPPVPAGRSSIVSHLNPISSAYAAPPEVSPDDVQEVEEDSVGVNDAEPAPVQDIYSQDLDAPAASPAAPLVVASAPQAAIQSRLQTAPVAGNGQFVQLGAFRQQANAERLASKYRASGSVFVVSKPNSSGETLYHVRMGPYVTPADTANAIAQFQQSGVDAKIIRE